MIDDTEYDDGDGDLFGDRWMVIDEWWSMIDDDGDSEQYGTSLVSVELPWTVMAMCS